MGTAGPCSLTRHHRQPP